jgi:ketosteroid isomerase-like protein
LTRIRPGFSNHPRPTRAKTVRDEYYAGDPEAPDRDLARRLDDLRHELATEWAAQDFEGDLGSDEFAAEVTLALDRLRQEERDSFPEY